MLDFAAVLACCYLGFALIALTQDQHRKRVAERAGRQGARARRMQRIAGSAMLACGLGVAMLIERADFASLLWILSVTLGAQLVTATLAWRPAMLRPMLRGEARRDAPSDPGTSSPEMG